MSFVTRRLAASSSAIILLAAVESSALAQKKYDVGATDTDIKIGNIMPYSGPASAYSVIGRMEAAYFRKVNEDGGINGRKINFISYDDAYSPPKTVEKARRLVEGDEVLFIFSPLGTPSNSAIRKYLNNKKVPQLFVVSGATKWNDPKHFPWTMGFQASYQSEARVYAKYILQEKPDAKIAVLYQNDDLGKDYLKGLKNSLGAKAASMIVAEESYETATPTIDTHIVKLRSSGADVFFDVATPKFAAQAIRKVALVGWKPLHLLVNASSSIAAVMKPAGFENSQGIISATSLKGATDPQWTDDQGVTDLLSFLKKYLPDADPADSFVALGYAISQTMVQVLRQCGDDLTRQNVMRQAASLKSFRSEILLPGITIDTSPTDFAPISQFNLMRFERDRFKRFGDVIDGDVGG
jgi:ABC-type branched-subunit amino acid transport system substrate-binding protein